MVVNADPLYDDSPMSGPQRAHARRCIQVLKLWPCSCSDVFVKEIGRKVTLPCARCKAIKNYEEAGES